jgi:hypothetical protein
MKYYIKDNFYFDIDQLNQFRITGPENHLFLGLTFPKELTIEVENYGDVRGQLEVYLRLSSNKLSFSAPIVTDIRTLRNFTEAKRPQPTYAELLESKLEEVQPQFTRLTKTGGKHVLKYVNSYEDNGRTKRYGVKIMFPKSYKVYPSGSTISVVAPEPVTMQIRTVTNIKLNKPLKSEIFTHQEELPKELFNKILLDLYKESGQNVEHLVKAKKTSSFEYGTIFPRDWIESADLGVGDFTQSTIDYMYRQSMRYVSESGEGWHEEAIGQYRTKLDDERAIVDRKMIDIEPRYIIGLQFVSKSFMTSSRQKEKLRRIAHFLVKNAEERSLITFKKMSESGEEFYVVGNWRDSYNAFPRQMSPLAPYDVNCVFYPVCLSTIRRYHDYFGIRETKELDEIIYRWEQNKLKFRLYHPNDTIGYALALHGKKNIPIPIAHLDESYDLFYGSPSMEEVVSFAHKLIDPDYFYTPSGPLLVAADEESMTSGMYHGKVIWPKQAAFAVAGLARHFRYGRENSWPAPVLDTIKNSIIYTCRACFRGWEELGLVPELYYYDTISQKARFYTDQEEYEGQMSLIQLWSSVGVRRIMREYFRIMTE